MVVLNTTKSDFLIKASSLRKDEVFNLLVYMSACSPFAKELKTNFTETNTKRIVLSTKAFKFHYKL